MLSDIGAAVGLAAHLGRGIQRVEVVRFIVDNYRAVAKLIDGQPNTVMHGDAHPGNVYFRDGHAGLLDWQAVRRGHPGRELSYTLVTGMTATDRRSYERELLTTYRHALAAPAARIWTPTSCGCVTGRARCTRTWYQSPLREWAACRTKALRWRAVGAAWPHSEIERPLPR